MQRFDKDGHELKFTGKKLIQGDMNDKHALALGYKVGDWASKYECEVCDRIYLQKETLTEKTITGFNELLIEANNQSIEQTGHELI